MNVRKVSALAAAGACAAVSFALMPTASAATNGNVEVCSGPSGSGTCNTGSGITAGVCYATKQTTLYAANFANGTVYFYAGDNCSGRGIGIAPKGGYNFGSSQIAYRFSN